jgi:hypothetical protein
MPVTVMLPQLGDCISEADLTYGEAGVTAVRYRMANITAAW